MLSYELCKKLKEAGFPQPTVEGDDMWYLKDNFLEAKDNNGNIVKTGFRNFDGCFHCGDDFHFYEDDEDGHIIWSTRNNDWDKENCIYLPTLERLIQECGDQFGSLTKTYKNWKCLDSQLNIGDMTWTVGDRPEEAVANLWLSLNEKK